MMRAQRRLLNPSIGRTMRLIARWSCSTTLFRYFDCRILIGTSRSALIAFSPARFAPLLSIVTVSGTPFNGLSQGAAYGDDFQDATNFPLVRIVNQATGHVFYCRTHNHSTMAVATGTRKVSTNFDVPAGAETGLSQLFVVANGIPSSPYSIKVR